jgi:hypothetical protein
MTDLGNRQAQALFSWRYEMIVLPAPAYRELASDANTKEAWEWPKSGLTYSSAPESFAGLLKPSHKFWGI